VKPEIVSAYGLAMTGRKAINEKTLTIGQLAADN
jgi:hypothetical protein